MLWEWKFLKKAKYFCRKKLTYQYFIYCPFCNINSFYLKTGYICWERGTIHWLFIFLGFSVIMLIFYWKTGYFHWKKVICCLLYLWLFSRKNWYISRQIQFSMASIYFWNLDNPLETLVRNSLFPRNIIFSWQIHQEKMLVVGYVPDQIMFHSFVLLVSILNSMPTKYMNFWTNSYFWKILERWIGIKFSN